MTWFLRANKWYGSQEAQASGFTQVDLSDWEVVQDVDSILNAVDDSTITFNKSSTFAADNPAILKGPEITDGESVGFTLWHDNRSGSGKDVLAIGLMDDNGILVAYGLNAAASTGTSDLRYDVGAGWTNDTSPNAQERISGLFRYMDGKIHRTMTLYYEDDGKTNAVATTKSNSVFAVTGSVYICAIMSINDDTGGALAPNSYNLKISGF